MGDKIKLLWVGDGATHTGFSQVSTGLLSGLHATGRYQITQLGINWLDVGPNDVPWEKVAAGFWHRNGNRFEADDPFGTVKLQQWVQARDWDIIVINNDYPIASAYLLGPDGSPTPLALSNALKVLYAPLDSQPCPPGFAATAKRYDLNIAYTFWQRDLMAAADPAFASMPVMYHGVDLDIYKPMDKAEAKRQMQEIFDQKTDGRSPDFSKRYLVYEVGTNQWRKSMPVLFRAYADFRKKVKNAFLLPHTSANPSAINGGWNLRNLAAICDVQDAVIMDNASQFTQEEMAVLMNAADVLAYPTRGEGFGIPSLEAMACKTPVVATNFGPQHELHANGRGYLVKVVDSIPGEPGCLTFFAEPDWRDMARKLYHVYANPDEVAGVVEQAYAFAQKHSWASKAEQLDGLLAQALAQRESVPLAA